MTRLGWVILIAVVLLVGLFASVLRFGGSEVRPSSPTPAPEPSNPTAQPLPGGALVLPVLGVGRDAILDSWGDPRGGGRGHEGTDIMAPLGTPVVAAAPGTVEKLFYSEGGGGITLYLRSPDRRWSYYYAHLAGYAPGVHEGQRVRVGQTLGFVGDTGNAGRGNYHLHFGISRMEPGEHWHEGTPVDPYPLLAGGGKRR